MGAQDKERVSSVEKMSFALWLQTIPRMQNHCQDISQSAYNDVKHMINDNHANIKYCPDTLVEHMFGIQNSAAD